MDSELIVSGAIVDSWLERPRTTGRSRRLVLQVAPRGRPKDLMIVEADTALVPDDGWLEDLGANLCHGSPVEATGRRSGGGLIRATRLSLAR